MARTRERLDDYTLALQQHGLEGVEREVRWLNELIANEQGGEDNLPTSRKEGRDGFPPGGHRRRGNCAASLVQVSSTTPTPIRPSTSRV